MRIALTDNSTEGISIAGRHVSNLRYADDTTLLEKNADQLKQLINKVKTASEAAGLDLNLNKTKIMTTSDLRTFDLDGHNIETVDSFNFLGVAITPDILYRSEIHRRIGMGKAAMTRLHKIWKDKNVSLGTKISIVRALVFPVMTYGSESWVLTKRDRKRVDSFEMWCYRRLLRIPWTEKRTNAWVAKSVKSNQTLEASIAKLQLQYTGHILRTNSLEKDILTGTTQGERRRGRPKKSFWSEIKDLLQCDTTNILKMARDRNIWRLSIGKITRGRTRLDGTR